MTSSAPKLERHQRRAAQELQRRRRGQRQPAVRGVDEAARARDGRALDAVDAELLERQRDAADVGQGVEPADLVEVHELGLAVVHARLGLGQQPERLVRAPRCARGQRGGVDQLAHVREVAMDVLLVRHHDLDAARRDAVSHGAPDLQVEPFDAQRAHVLGHALGARAGVDQGGQQHVAGGAADAVDVGDARHEAPAARRAMRAAIVPGAEAVVDVHAGDAGRTRGEHREQRGDASERRAVARARRHRDHGRGHDAADDARERRVHARDHDHAVGLAQRRRDREDAVEPGHAAVLVQLDVRAAQLGADARLVGGRCVRGAGRDDRDAPAGASGATGIQAQRARSCSSAPASTRRTAARAASSARVTSTELAPPSRSARTMASISSGVLPSASTASGAPCRASRSRSTFAKPRSAKLTR